MASGDATKVWFKDVEMLLVARWRGDMSAAELAALAADLTRAASRLREERGMLPPIYRCSRCQTSARAQAPVIHVGSMIFAAKKLGVIGDDEVLGLRRLWARHSSQVWRRIARDKAPLRALQEEPAHHGECVSLRS